MFPFASQSLSLRRVAALAAPALCCLMCAQAPAALIAWNNSGGGSFHVAANWNPAVVPTALDDAEFDIGSLYTVTFSGNASTASMDLIDDDAIFNLQSFTYTISTGSIGEVGATSRLRVINGTLALPALVPPAISILAVGDGLGEQGTLILGSGGHLTAGGEFYVGNVGNGLFEVQTGASATTATTTIGDDPGSIGTAQVRSGVTWNNSGTLIVGNFGDGLLDIASNALVQSGVAIIGDDAGGVGTANLNGANARITTTSTLNVGNSGAGDLNLQNGAKAQTSSLFIGDDPSGDGQLTLTGTGSNLTTTSTAFVGNYGIGQININAGTAMSAPEIFLGDEINSAGTLIVQGPSPLLPEEVSVDQVRSGADRCRHFNPVLCKQLGAALRAWPDFGWPLCSTFKYTRSNSCEISGLQRCERPLDPLAPPPHSRTLLPKSRPLDGAKLIDSTVPSPLKGKTRTVVFRPPVEDGRNYIQAWAASQTTTTPLS